MLRLYHHLARLDGWRTGGLDALRCVLVADERVYATSFEPTSKSYTDAITAAAARFGILELLPHLSLHPLPCAREILPRVTQCYDALLTPPVTEERWLHGHGSPALRSWYLLALAGDFLRSCDFTTDDWVPRPPPGPTFGPYSIVIVANEAVYQTACYHRGPTFGAVLEHVAARWEMSELLPHVTAHRLALQMQYRPALDEVKSGLRLPGAAEPVDRAALLGDEAQVPVRVWYLLLVDGGFISTPGIVVPPGDYPLHTAIHAAVAARRRTFAEPPTRASFVSLLCGLLPRFTSVVDASSRGTAGRSPKHALIASSRTLPAGSTASADVGAAAESDAIATPIDRSIAADAESELRPLRPQGKTD